MQVGCILDTCLHSIFLLIVLRIAEVPKIAREYFLFDLKEVIYKLHTCQSINAPILDKRLFMEWIDAYWNLDNAYILTKLSSSVRGLTSEEANRSQKEFGTNYIKGRSLRSTFVLFLTQFKEAADIVLLWQSLEVLKTGI